MEAMSLLIKLILYSIIGYFIIRIFKKKPHNEMCPFEPGYMVFALLSINIEIKSIIWIFILGIIWGIVVNVFISSINDKLVMNINPIYFGLLNIINVLIFEKIFDKIILFSPTNILAISSILLLTVLIEKLTSFLQKNF